VFHIYVFLSQLLHRVCEVARSTAGRLASMPSAPSTGSGGGRPSHTALGGAAVEERSVAEVLRAAATAAALAAADTAMATAASTSASQQAAAAANAAAAAAGSDVVVMFEDTYEPTADNGNSSSNSNSNNNSNASARAPDTADGSARHWARYRGEHVIVLCHGYQGSSWDMRLFKNALAVRCPTASFLLSSVNEGRTESSIKELGARLAREIVDFIIKQCPSSLGRLSFVGHSMGGVIIRAALAEPLLQPFLRHCYSFVTLASPHCGYIFSEAPLVSTGLWFLRKWTKSKSLAQLSFSDGSSYSDCFVYRLAQEDTLRHFRYLYLMASREDKYAPFFSARIQTHADAGGASAAAAGDGKNRAYRTMVLSLLRHLTPNNTGSGNGDDGSGDADGAPATPMAVGLSAAAAAAAAAQRKAQAQVLSRARAATAAGVCACLAPYIADAAEATAAVAAAAVTRGRPCPCAGDGATAAGVPQVFRRLEVSFGARQRRTLDAFTGRQAHIFFLDVPQYINMFLALHWKAFL